MILHPMGYLGLKCFFGGKKDEDNTTNKEVANKKVYYKISHSISLISYILFFSALFPCYENGRKAGNVNFGFLIQTADHFR